MMMKVNRWRACMAAGVLAFLAAPCSAQSGLESLPGYDRYQLITGKLWELNAEGRITRPIWTEDGAALLFRRDGLRLRFDLADHTVREMADDEDEAATRQAVDRRRPARGHQRDVEPSPDGRWRAVSRDWNVYLEDASSETAPIALTTDGERKHRYGRASWVYGEELDQIDAMWWSPDSTKLAYYEFDERLVPDYYLAAGLLERHTTPLIEGYPKPGDPNPIANLWIHDLNTGEKVRVDVGSPAQETDRYIYTVRFSPDGSELLFNRTNRRQNVLHVMAADVRTGISRIVLTETQETWQENSPTMRFLEDGRRFIWQSERTGWKHYELRHIDGRLLNVLTRGDYVAGSIVRVDEEAGVMFYMAYSDENPLNQHLHRVNLDGTGEKRLTSESLNHSIDMSPCGQWFIARGEATGVPSSTWIYDSNGTRLETLAEGSWANAAELGLTPPELFTFKADDGETDLYGVLYKPSNFDPAKKYPLVIDVYGGPLSQRVRNTYNAANASCEFGFIIAQIDNRGTANRGKSFEDAAYLKLGIVDLKDQADAVRYLTARTYIDGDRVGIFGGSYGGYLAALALLKYPDVFHVGVAAAAVTDWRNYDTIYTERFMRLPDENLENYDEGSCIPFAKNLQGKLLIQHGMMDDNVHPNNAWQLIDALHRANREFDLMMYPTRGHGLGPHAGVTRWQYLHRHLVLSAE
ncbi:MAG TPA: DPP IV N-terminal domain-containing protein [Phycisphaerales bacterium]|nr:DPP IV N-terminal domain-containing protein [Phycisphaerales bacterium]HRQ74525.1 DPP IV N-terminal domain-containing protein [Phycisphaerales bacterium]